MEYTIAWHATTLQSPGLGAAEDHLGAVFNNTHFQLTDIAQYMGIDPAKAQDQEKWEALKAIPGQLRTLYSMQSTKDPRHDPTALMLAGLLDKLLPPREAVYGV